MSNNSPTSIYEHPRFGGKRPIDGDSGGPHDPVMEARISKLEEHVGNIRVDVARIDTKLDGVLAHMATKAWVLGGALVTVLAILGAGWWMIQQYLGPILQHLGK